MMSISVSRSLNAVRSGQMVQCLRDNLLYSEKRVRDVLFRSIEEILETNCVGGASIILSKLTREAAALGRRRAEQVGLDGVKWEMSARVVLNTMLLAGVLLGPGGQPVVAGVGAQGSPVSRLRAGFAGTSEAFLLEFLIRKLGDVSVRDHRALAHVLFRQFDPGVSLGDLEDQLALLFASLSGVIAMTAEGIYFPCAVERPAHLAAS